MDQNITAVPPPEASPPVSTPPAPARPRWNLVHMFCVLLLFVLAYFVGSFRVTNSDIWMTLAGGRLLATGAYQFGVDPFSWASDGAYWANPTWLGSWLMFAAYQTMGPSFLVFAKASLTVIVVGFLFSSRSKDTPILPAIEVTALAILTFSARLLLQTAIYSYVGLAMLVWILVRSGHFGGLAKDEERSTGWRWQIPLLFLVWSNLDGLYVLGLLALVLTFLGVCFVTFGRGAAKELVVVVGLSFVACVLNPHLFSNLTMPNDLATILPSSFSAAGTAAADLSVGDESLIPTISPFTSRAISAINFNIAGLASYLFFAVAVGSFVAAAFVPDNPRILARALVAIGFGILAGVQIRLVPIFAIVVGPLVVLNITDYARWTRATERASKGGVVVATGATLLTLLAAIFLAWPGWLHLSLSSFQGDALFNSPRRVDWTLMPDPAFRAAVESLRKTPDIDDGKQVKAAEVRVFHNVFDVAHYAAFFAPEIRTGIDLRLSLFAKKAAEYAEVRNALWKENESLGAVSKRTSKDESKQMHRRLEEWAINGMAVAVLPRTFETRTELIGLNSLRNRELAMHLIRRPKEWTPRNVNGVTFAFAKRPENAEIDPLMNQWKRAAFGVTPKETWLSSDTASRPPRELNWETLYAVGLGVRPVEIDTAGVQLYLFQEVARGWATPFYVATQCTQFLPAAGLSASGAGVGLPLACMQRMAMYDILANVPTSRGSAFRAQEMGPPALPILMHRELRTAVHKNRLLAEGYNHLADAVQLNLEQEDWWARPRFPGVRTRLRQMEIAAARRAAVTVAPTSIEARLRYIDYLGSQHHLDAAVFERGNIVALLESAPANETSLREFFPELHQSMVAEIRQLDFKKMKLAEPINVPEEFAKRFAKIRSNIQERYAVEKKDLEKRQKDFELRAVGMPELQRFRVAVLEPWTYTDADNKTSSDPRGRGLALEGIRSLERMQSANDNEKAERTYWLIRLYCQVGMVNEAYDALLAAENETHFVQPECMIWVGAATGDYDVLDRSLALLEKRAGEEIARSVVPVLDLTLTLNSLSHLPTGPRIGQGLWIQQWFYPRARAALDANLAEQAEMRFLRGLFALDRGDTAAAGEHFERAVEEGRQFPDRPIAERYRLLIRAESR